MIPLGRTRTPKRGSLPSQTANSFACGFRLSTIRLVMRWSAMLTSKCRKNPLGKHRGNTEKKTRGTSRNQDIIKDAHYKRFFGIPGKMRKLRELNVFRMAFKRSGVRLPLAPPSNSLITAKLQTKDIIGGRSDWAW